MLPQRKDSPRITWGFKNGILVRRRIGCGSQDEADLDIIALTLGNFGGSTKAFFISQAQPETDGGGGLFGGGVVYDSPPLRDAIFWETIWAAIRPATSRGPNMSLHNPANERDGHLHAFCAREKKPQSPLRPYFPQESRRIACTSRGPTWRWGGF